MNQLTDEQLREIRERCEKATEGPWKSFVEGRDHQSGSSFIQTAKQDIELHGATVEDQDFIAAARQDVISLLDTLELLSGTSMNSK